MNDLVEIQELVKEVAEHLRAGSKTEKKMARIKLERISAIAQTLALTIQVHG